MNRLPVILAITGASGAAYAHRLLHCLLAAEIDVHLVASVPGRRLMAEELGITEWTSAALLGRDEPSLVFHSVRQIGSVLASGSFRTMGMIICPCSGNTLGAVAAGLGGNLIERAAAVTLKEQRRLIVVPREMPWSRIDLQNAMRLSDAGAVICPASPGFYLQPKTVPDLVDFVVGKLLDLLDVPHTLTTRWAEQPNADRGKSV